MHRQVHFSVFPNAAMGRDIAGRSTPDCERAAARVGSQNPAAEERALPSGPVGSAGRGQHALRREPYGTVIA